MEWSDTPAISIQNPGFLGNRLYQFFALKSLAAAIGDCVLANFSFPEWNILLPPVDNRRYRRTILIRRNEDFDIPYLAETARREKSVHIIVDLYLQRSEFFLDRSIYRQIFPILSHDVPVFDERYLVINIRTGDIRTGHVPFYPLTPIRFWRYLADLTNLTPVFMGQLDEGDYVSALRHEFPDAEFVPSQGAIRDFDILRRAANIAPAVSTFSLAAAWLSNARSIFLQVNGFLNPSHLREVDLLPLGDERYRYFLFPMNFALPESEALLHHARIEGLWREVSATHLQAIALSSPLVQRNRPELGTQIPLGFDERWYLHTYIDAAQRISEGVYYDALHHYIDIGRRIGYRPGPILETPSMPDLARGARAWQSSLSQWSAGKTINEDAMRAVDGVRGREYAFHTEQEDNPWWVVDLGKKSSIVEIHVQNRRGPWVVREKAFPLVVLVSDDASEWVEYGRAQSEDQSLETNGTLSPVVFRRSGKVECRFVKVLAERQNTNLHLAAVEVFGYP
ncbi:MAG: discoidin domain-containing protein [Rhodospirillales bacterium]|nr:discoidin domain-containing protein [Rhodospirillales bacterium]